MRPATTTVLPARLRQLAAGTTAAVLALTLAPAAANAQEPTEEFSETVSPVSVRLKVATQPAVEIAVAPRVWPTRLVKQAGVPVDGNDLVKVVRDGRLVVDASAKRVRDGDTVRLVDVVKQRRTSSAKVPAGTVEVPTTKLAPGRRKVVREGRPGVRQVVAVRTLHNGEPVSFRVVARTIVRDPRPRRVLVGREPWSVPGADGLNWAALARCESGGNPPRGQPGRLLRPLPVQRRDLEQRRWVRYAAPRIRRRADLSREAPLRLARPFALAPLRPSALSNRAQ